MKLSVSLPEDDVRFIDEYSARVDVTSRSSVIQIAIGLLRHSSMEQEYADAFAEWDASGEAALWDATALDGPVADGPAAGLVPVGPAEDGAADASR
ncbi:ribbon-helix-helix domain-containing protein [Actinokineospora sp.]|uniref:ribbon-helix-helix domain-containing protein n=1 Tax=Actinokineospora sp. TaxID=1872133 RepID=UPI004037D314